MRKKLCLAILALGLLLPVSTAQVASAASIVDFGSADATATKDWGVYKKYQYTENGNAQTLFYGEYKPTATSDYEFVVHTVRKADGSVQKSKVSAIAADFTAKTGRKVKMATNGDFFDLNTGTPIESLVIDGYAVQQGSYSNKNCFGFDNEGNVAIGRMTEVKDVLEVTLEGVSYRLDVDNTNQAPEAGEISLYTAATGLVLNDTVKYKVTASGEGTLLTGRPLEGTCGISVTNDKFSLSAGQYAIVAQKESKEAEFLSKALSYGASCRVVSMPAGAYEGMDYVVGGWDILVKDGKIVPSTHSTASDPNMGGVDAPRTMVGMKADGTMFLAVLDGRQSGYSVGCTVAEEGQLALALGAEFALELDGGGSSAFLFDLGEGLKLLNIPSDTSNGTHVERSVSNAVLLVEKDKNATKYASLDDYQSTTGGNESTGGNNGNESTGGSENTGNDDNGNGSTVTVEKAGCGSTVGGVSVILGGCFVCAIWLINRKKEVN